LDNLVAKHLITDPPTEDLQRVFDDALDATTDYVDGPNRNRDDTYNDDDLLSHEVRSIFQKELVPELEKLLKMPLKTRYPCTHSPVRA
jgi:hypothetical protein